MGVTINKKKVAVGDDVTVKALSTVVDTEVGQTDIIETALAALGEIKSNLLPDAEKKLKNSRAAKEVKKLNAEVDKHQVVLHAELIKGMKDDKTKSYAFGDYQADIGAIPKKREITNLERILEIVGEDTFLAIANINLGDLDKYLTPDQLEEVITTTRKGKHSFKFKDNS